MRRLSALLALLVIVAMFATATGLSNGAAVPQARDPVITVLTLNEVMSPSFSIASTSTEATIMQNQLAVNGVYYQKNALKENDVGLSVTINTNYAVTEETQSAVCLSTMEPAPEATARNGAISNLTNNARTMTVHADNVNFDNTA
jgi:hypothetical protein